jgi:hypothetical protein
MMRVTVQTPSDGVRVLRVRGALDGPASARLIRIVDDQLQRTGAEPGGHLVIDLNPVDAVVVVALKALRHARFGGDSAGVGIHLVGDSDRWPTPCRQLLTEFSTFATVDDAVASLAR